MLQLFNWFYFLAVILSVGSIIGLYFILKNKSKKTIYIVLASLLFFNLLLHFFKAFIPPYSLSTDRLVRDIWFINICAVSTLIFPFIFISKAQALKDFMFYLGVISGALAILYPTEAIGNIYFFDLLRFYICHTIIIGVPLLMVLLKVHQLNYHRIWKMPFCMLMVLLIVICNQVLQSELGFIPLRGDDISNIPYTNTSLIWGPTDAVSVVFTWLTPNFMKYVPYGEYAGTPKYWPFFYLVPGAFVYFLILPLLLCLPWEFKHIKNDFVLIKQWFALKKENKKNRTEKQICND